MRVQGQNDGKFFGEAAAPQGQRGSGAGVVHWFPGCEPAQHGLGRAGHGGGEPTPADLTARDELNTGIVTAEAYATQDHPHVTDPGSEAFPLAEAILGELVLRQKIAEGATQELIDIELALMDAMKREGGTTFQSPRIQVVPNGEILDGAGETIMVELADGSIVSAKDFPDVLPEGVNGAFVPGENGARGTILLSDQFIDANGDVVGDPELLEDVVLEEYGEALADHLVGEGFTEGTSDVGHRLMKVMTGQELTEDDFHADPDQDSKDVLFGGVIVEGAKASADDITGNDDSDVWEDIGQFFSDFFSSDGGWEPNEVEADALVDTPNAKFLKGGELESRLSTFDLVDNWSLEPVDVPDGVGFTLSGSYQYENRTLRGGTETITETVSLTVQTKMTGGGQKYLQISFPEEHDLENGESKYGGDRSMVVPMMVYNDKTLAQDAVSTIQAAIDASPATDKPQIDYGHNDGQIDSALVVDGQWYSWGYYGDGDGDGIKNGLDTDFSDNAYMLETIPEAAGIPADAVIDNIQDFGSGEEMFGTKDVRIVSYVGPTSGDAVVKTIDMTEGSDTFGQALNTLRVDGDDGSVAFAEAGSSEPDVVLTAEDIDVLEEEADRRRLETYESPLLIGLRDSLLEDGIEAGQEFGWENFAVATYEAPDGTATRVYRTIVDVENADGSVTPTTYEGTIVGNTSAGWLKINEVLDELNAADASEAAFNNTLETTRETSAFFAKAGATLGVIAGSAVPGFGIFPGAAAGAAVGTTLGGLVGLASGVVNGTRSIYHHIQSSKRMDELDTIAEPEVIVETDETDLGVIGQDRPAYFIPEDAEILGSSFVPAESGPYGVDTKEFLYTRPGEEDTVYVVSIDASDPGGARDGLVLHATKTVSEAVDGVVLSDVTTYDSFGTATDTVFDLDLTAQVEPITEAELMGDPEADLAHIEDKVYELHPDAEILEMHSAGPLTYASYKLPDKTGIRVHMLERVTEDGVAGHTYEQADGWLSGDVTAMFFDAFNHFKTAVNIYVELNHYYTAGALTLDVLDYFRQNIDFAGIASMFTADGTSTTLTPRESATVRHVGTISAIVPFLMRGAITSAAQWATAQGGPACFSLAGNCFFRATGEESAVDLQGENGDIEPASAPTAPQNTPVPPALIDVHWQLGAQQLVPSTNPDGLCFGMATTYLDNRLRNGISQTGNYEIQVAAQQAAPIENQLADATSRSLVTDVYRPIVDGINENMAHFRRMANDRDTSVTNWLTPDIEGYGRESVYASRYASNTALATIGLEAEYQYHASELGDAIDFITSDASEGKAFFLNFVSTSSDGHQTSFVHELDGSITVMEANLGVVRFQDPNRLKDLFLRSFNTLPNISHYDVAEVKVGTDDDSPRSPAKVLAWYQDLTGEDASTYGSGTPDHDSL